MPSSNFAAALSLAPPLLKRSKEQRDYVLVPLPDSYINSVLAPRASLHCVGRCTSIYTATSSLAKYNGVQFEAVVAVDGLVCCWITCQKSARLVDSNCSWYLGVLVLLLFFITRARLDNYLSLQSSSPACSSTVHQPSAFVGCSEKSKYLLL